MTFSKLTKTNNNYEVNSKVPFSSRTNAECDIQDLEQAFLFSWNMTFGATGEHRSYRSGGQLVRNNLQKFCDVFIGKLGEVAFFNISKKRPMVTNITEIDYECYGLGKWDSSDFIINYQYHIAVKTTKHFGNLLLLEENTIKIPKQTEGAYISPLMENFVTFVHKNNLATIEEVELSAFESQKAEEILVISDEKGIFTVSKIRNKEFGNERYKTMLEAWKTSF